MNLKKLVIPAMIGLITFAAAPLLISHASTTENHAIALSKESTPPAPPTDSNGKPLPPPKDANGKPLPPPDKKLPPPDSNNHHPSTNNTNHPDDTSSE